MQIVKRKMHSGGPIAIDEQAKRSQSFCTPQSTFCIAAANGRSGLSLMEVLISIGIVAIGLLSVAALLPVGGLLVQRAEIADRTANLGQNAFLEFKTRGLGDPTKWLSWNGPGPMQDRWVNWGTNFYRPTPMDTNLSAQLPVVIDPWMCAIGNGSTADRTAIATFPVVDSSRTSLPLMRRITVTPACTTSAGPVTNPNRALAEAIFRGADDIAVEQPEDERLPVTNQYYNDGANNLKRETYGQYSWLATITLTDPRQMASGLSQGDLVTVSMVIFDERPALVPSSSNLMESLVSVTFPPGATGIGGADVTLTGTEEELELAYPGQWLMLCRKELTGLGTPYDEWGVFKWFRIVSAGETQRVGANYERNLTLSGPDWLPNPAGAGPTYAALVGGVATVYQRTMRIQGPGRWGE